MICCPRKQWFRLLFCGLLFFCAIGLKVWAENAVFAQGEARFHFDVRVLLAKEFVPPADKSSASGGYPLFNEWVLSSTEGFEAIDQENGLSETVKDKVLRIGVKGGRLAINGRRLKANVIELRPVSGETTFGKYRYAGLMRLMLEENGEIYLVNQLDIEEYIFSVIRWESVPNWPLEANKAMAIACRTYVVNKVLLARREHIGKPYHYDIRATNSHQTYHGLHEFESLRRPVDETRGVVMAYRRFPTSKLEVIEALYDACCGGSSPAKMTGVINFDQAPYLKRPKTCRYCRNCKLYHWYKEYSLAEVDELMRFTCPSLFVKKGAHVTDIRVSRRDESGVVHKLQVKVGNAWYSLTGEQVYSIFRGTKSRMFTVEMVHNRVIFKGRGVGHGLGLCQWGAYKMARMGKKCQEILEFYYTDAIVFTTIQVTSG